ncbi:putative c6 transcription protein [Daldinia childiae]|uniref:putative c6 transcription protein n=1 Tax=Daldinia childiae TaxID=326645 RepID=UPI001445918E|nr:putative c6 transcription protein [Daldinia childiae]KAF3055890.1 putative c6 transcription protein [Daldinia childiae]
MASFFGALLRLLFKKRQQEGHIDEEQGAQNAIPAAGVGSTPIASTLGTNSNILPHTHQSYLVPEDNRLTLFRLMVGISTSPYLGYSESSPVGTRPAANIGIYARVVHSEQKSKDRYKVFSILINACYFFQIVVAASITAMGAAGVSHGAVTAFGAINTIIAGLLTFLRGSGLPGRLKYYGNEWKKIREFIEQRERDFSRTGCTLDVYEVVAAIDRMYNHTKQEIEMNTPDSYTSVTRNVRNFRDSSDNIIDISKVDGLAHKLAANMESKAQDVTNHVRDQGRRMQEATAREVESHAAYLDREVEERRAQAVRAVDESQREISNQRDRIEQAGAQVVRDVDETQRAAMGEMRATASAQVQKVADKIGHHDSKHEEDEK